MKGKLLLLMLLIASCASYAQNTTTSSYIVKGILVDSLTLEGEPYATIKIVEKKAPDKAVKMAVTDMQGNFKEKMNAQPGMYVITICILRRLPMSWEALRLWLKNRWLKRILIK